LSGRPRGGDVYSSSSSPSHRSIVPRPQPRGQRPVASPDTRPLLLFSHPLPSSCVSLFLMSAHTMAPYIDHQPHTAIKSESPPLQSVAISSIGQSYSPYPSSDTLFRFGTKDQISLPPFSFISRPRSSSFSPLSSMSHLNAYSSAVSGSQSHFPVPPADDPAGLTPTDEYDDGDDTGDFPSGSGSSKIDKTVRRRSSKGASLFLSPSRVVALSIVLEPSLRPMS